MATEVKNQRRIVSLKHFLKYHKSRSELLEYGTLQHYYIFSPSMDIRCELQRGYPVISCRGRIRIELDIQEKVIWIHAFAEMTGRMEKYYNGRITIDQAINGSPSFPIRSLVVVPQANT